jgi:hypothetical protein
MIDPHGQREAPTVREKEGIPNIGEAGESGMTRLEVDDLIDQVRALSQREATKALHVLWSRQRRSDAILERRTRALCGRIDPDEQADIRQELLVVGPCIARRARWSVLVLDPPDRA